MSDEKHSLIEVPISIGELCDKISILLIKSHNISFGSEKWQIVYKELGILSREYGRDFQSHLKDLISVNTELWATEDKIRELYQISPAWTEEQKSDFIEACIQIRVLNDQRANIKYNLNKLYNSEIYEVKEYAG